MVEFLVAFGTDDGESLNNDHVGMAKYFNVYRFRGGEEDFVEQRKNIGSKEDESMKHGDPVKATATSSALGNVDVVVGKKFGPNLPRLLKKFVCVLVRTDAISNAIEAVHSNIGRIVEEKNKGEGRKHIVLRQLSDAQGSQRRWM